MRVKAKCVLLLVLLTVLGITLLYNYHAAVDEEVPGELTRRERLLLQQVTRDPNRVIHYNYPITNEASISREPIDISVEMPAWQEVDKHIVVVTGFSQKKAYVGLGLIASVQAHMPVKKIIVYNLGVHPKIVKQMEQMCNVEVRRFNFTNYPKHAAKIDNKAWKIFALREVLMEYGGFFYASPQVRFRAPINFIIPYILKHEGIIAITNPQNLSVEVTHPDLYGILRTSPARFTKAHPNAFIASEHMWLALNGSVPETKIWTPLLDCASNWRCIGPHGSTWGDIEPNVNGTKAHTHRYDMSALSLLLYRNYYDSWHSDTSMNAILKRIADVIYHLDLHDYLWAHYCNPPKKEIDCSIERKLC
ncbi:uncharacterized protein LOC105445447 [Strongylocentrotus purpuratus]|uniref:Uncharacterized protein n=1 Tax=Strongylocentrotus purpuratus TaxID=7668 RepID=A0A7M7PJH5_STRPU|nr:uncharacterized protein LOC105445447 [Strongylocentrotus purpuratus]